MRFILSLVLALSLSVSAFAQQAAISNTSFNAIARGPQVMLTWNPGTTEVVSYQLEKSKNGSDFIAFGQIEGTTKLLEFIETDFQPFEGLSYYRLKLTLSNGTVGYSNTVPVKYNSAGEPVSPVAVEKEKTSSADESVLVVVRNSSGEEFYSKVDIANEGNPVECTVLDPVLSAGTYTIIGCSDQNYYSKQMLVK